MVIIKRAADTLPDHVKGNIFWAPASHRPAGYYLQDQQTYEYNPVEFIDNYWYFLDNEDEQVTTSLSSRIEPNTLGTGYWHTYDPEHPLFRPVPVPSTSAVTLDIPTEPQGGPLTDDPAISPLLAAPNPQAAYSFTSIAERHVPGTSIALLSCHVHLRFPSTAGSLWSTPRNVALGSSAVQSAKLIPIMIHASIRNWG